MSDNNSAETKRQETFRKWWLQEYEDNPSIDDWRLRYPIWKAAITHSVSELSASQAREAELREKLESENNLKNLYHGELLQTADQRNELAKKLEAAEAKLKEISEAQTACYQYTDEAGSFISRSTPDALRIPPNGVEVTELIIRPIINKKEPTQ